MILKLYYRMTMKTIATLAPIIEALLQVTMCVNRISTVKSARNAYFIV